MVQNSVLSATVIFFSNFHKYTLTMTSPTSLKQLIAIFRTEILKFIHKPIRIGGAFGLPSVQIGLNMFN